MSSSKFSKEQLQQLAPSQVESYLISRGWNIDGEIGRLAKVWHRPDEAHSQFELLLPLSPKVKDFYDRILDLINELATFENRPIENVIEDLLSFYNDVIRLRIIHEDVGDGSVPLDDGVLLVESARELINSAAMSTVKKEKYHIITRYQETIDFLSNVRLGQTDAGSYVITLISPIAKPKDDLFPEVEKMSFPRLVIKNLASGLQALKTTTADFKKTNNPNVFLDAVSEGASANMCDAIINISGKQQHRDIEISMSLSSIERSASEIPTNVLFTKNEIPFIRKASEYFKENIILLAQTISGYVTRLNREADNELGTIQISTVIDDKVKHVSVELNENDYVRAIHAHEKKLYVTCKGDLHIAPRSAQLLSPSEFSVSNEQVNMFE